MNSFEKIISTIQGQKTDKKAFTATLSQYGSKYCRASNQEYYQNAEIYAAGQKVIYEKFQTDVIFAPFALALIGKAFGAELKFYADRPPMVRKPALLSVTDLINRPYPDIHSNTDLMYLRNSVKILTQHFKQTVPVAGIFLNPVDIPLMILGIEKYLDIFLFNKTDFEKLMEYIVPFFIDFTNTLLADGAACVIMPTVFANSETVTRQQAEEIVNPVLKSAFSKINGALIMHHGGVPFLPYFDTYKNFPENVIGFAINHTDNFETARKIIDNRVILHGIEGPSMYMKTKNEIKSDCMKILEITKNDTKHVLITCSSDILCQTPEENIMAMKEAVDEFYN